MELSKIGGLFFKNKSSLKIKGIILKAITRGYAVYFPFCFPSAFNLMEVDSYYVSKISKLILLPNGRVVLLLNYVALSVFLFSLLKPGKS